jgi:hypothetical protein
MPRQPNGTYSVTSTIDMVPQISVDNGQTWTPANSPIALVFMPEPGTFALAATAAAGLFAAALRRRRAGR